MVASFEIIIQDFPQLIFTYHLFYIYNFMQGYKSWRGFSTA